MQNIDSLLERFAYLDARASRGRRGVGRGGDMQRHFQQVELFYLAQAICYQVEPETQRYLDEYRRRVMDEVTRGPTGIGSMVVPLKRATPRWSDYQITPEFSGDISVTGRFVSKVNVQGLKTWHKVQVQTVVTAVEDWKRANSHAG